MNLDHVRSIRGDRGEVFSPGDLELLHQGPSNLGGDWGGGQSEYGDVQGDQGIGWDWDIYAEGDESVNVGWDWNTYAGHNVNVGEGIEGDGYDDAGWDWNDMPGWDGEGSGGGSRGGGCGGAGLAGENELMGR